MSYFLELSSGIMDLVWTKSAWEKSSLI